MKIFNFGKRYREKTKKYPDETVFSTFREGHNDTELGKC